MIYLLVNTYGDWGKMQLWNDDTPLNTHEEAVEMQEELEQNRMDGEYEPHIFVLLDPAVKAALEAAGVLE